MPDDPRRLMRRTKLVWIALALAAFQSDPAWAQGNGTQPQAEIAAEALFQQAVVLRQQGQWREACDTFRASQRLAPARGTLLNIAECHERFGDIASAWSAYKTLADLATAAGDQERLQIARRKVRELEPRLPRLTVMIAPDARVDGLELQLDGMPIDATLSGVSFPVDAGVHVIEATAPGHSPYRREVTVAERRHHELTIPRLTAIAADPAPPSGAGPPGGGGRVSDAAGEDRAQTVAIGVNAGFESLRANHIQPGWAPTVRAHVSRLHDLGRAGLAFGGELGLTRVAWSEADVFYAGTGALTVATLLGRVGLSHEILGRLRIFLAGAAGLLRYSKLEDGNIFTTSGMGTEKALLAAYGKAEAGLALAIAPSWTLRVTPVALGLASARENFNDGLPLPFLSVTVGLLYQP